MHLDFQNFQKDESICHFKGVGSVSSFLDGKIMLTNNVDPDQMPH